jgi:hypothetical protein
VGGRRGEQGAELIQVPRRKWSEPQAELVQRRGLGRGVSLPAGIGDVEQRRAPAVGMSPTLPDTLATTRVHGVVCFTGMLSNQ